MELFKDLDRTYAKRETAIKKAQEKHPKLLQELNWVVACNEQGRFFIVFIGAEALHRQTFHLGYATAA